MPYTQDNVTMVDKGFEIHNLLDPIGVTLNVPIFLRLQGEDVMETQQIASKCVHVEQAISKVKKFYIFLILFALLTLFQRPLISQNVDVIEWTACYSCLIYYLFGIVMYISFCHLLMSCILTVFMFI